MWKMFGEINLESSKIIYYEYKQAYSCEAIDKKNSNYGVK